MIRYNKKFFFDENNKSNGKNKYKDPKPKKIKSVKEKPVKEAKPKKAKETKTTKKTFANVFSAQKISSYTEKINNFFKKWYKIIILIIFIVILILVVKSCGSNNASKKTTKKPKETINTTNPVIVDSITINLNQEVPSIDAFVKNYSKIKSSNDQISYDENNFVNNKYNSVGEYKVSITLNDKEYSSRIVVIDKDAPTFAVKELTITQGDSYTINDLVSSCSDNSGKECILSYQSQDYAKLTIPGTYSVPIIASDLSGNTAPVQNAKLTINAKKVEPTKPTCSYGSTKYSSSHILTYSLIKNNCPVDAKYAKTDTYISTPENMAKNDLEKLRTEINNKNISMKIYFQLNVVPILNNEKTGLVGYAAYINGYEVTYNNSTGKEETGKTVISYDLRSNGTRKYTVNELGL
ncbi:MAG: hypothetical protein IKX00_00140 [Bacilli bacterium]|nr:hypothetical protein [Bacilli bacterium]